MPVMIDRRYSVFVSGDVVRGAIISFSEKSIDHTEVTVHVQHGTLLNPAEPPSIMRSTLPRLPSPTHSFYNREQPLRAAARELQAGHGVWLTGPPGCGHTSLLRQLTSSLPEYPDGVLYVDGITAPRDLDDLIQALYNSFYTSRQGVVIRRNPHVARLELSQLKALFVLDRLWLNNHQLVSLTDTLARTGAVLVAADGIAPDSLLNLSLGSLPATDAMRLFVVEACVDEAQPDSMALVEHVCTVFEHLPLPLLLVARLVRLQMMMLDQLAAQAEALHPEREALSRAVQLVLRSLDDVERVVLAALVRTGGYDVSLEALAAISQVPLQAVNVALARLSNLGLVTGLHERYAVTSGSLRRVLARQLPYGDERRRAAAYFAGMTATHTGNLAWLGREAFNLMAGARVALAEGQAQQAGQLARAVHPYLVLQGYWNEWEHTIALAEQVARVSADEALRAWALHERGTRAGLLGDLTGAASLLNAAYRLRLELGDRAGARATLYNLECLELLPVFTDGADGADPSEPLLYGSGGLIGRVLILFIVVLGLGGIVAGLFMLFSTAGG